MKEPQSLEDNILYQLGELTRILHKRVTAIFSQKGFGVTVEQFGVLVLLWYQEGINQKDIALQLNRDKTTITRIINNMIKGNLVVKVPDQLDGRGKLIFLTQKGKALQMDMIESSGTVYYQAMNDISDEEISSCLKVLWKMKKNLNK